MIRLILYTTKLVRCRTYHVRHRTEKSPCRRRYWPPVPQTWQTTARVQGHVFDGPIASDNKMISLVRIEGVLVCRNFGHVHVPRRRRWFPCAF